MLEFISDFLGKQEIPKMNGTKENNHVLTLRHETEIY